MTRSPGSMAPWSLPSARALGALGFLLALSQAAHAQDLVPVSVRLSGSSLKAGQQTSVKVEVANMSGTTVASGWIMQVLLSRDSLISADDAVVGSLPVPASLAAGGRTTYDVPVIVPIAVPGGAHFVGARLDASNIVQETNEANNTSALQMVSVTNSAPDLIVSSGVPTVSAGTLLPGASVTVSAWKSRNQGATSAGSFTSGVYLSSDAAITTSDVLLGTVTVSRLAAGAEATSSLTGLVIPAGTTPGQYYMGVLLDRGGVVGESNEANNAALTGPFMILAPSVDLVMVSGPKLLPDSVIAGRSFTVGNWLIENRGTIASLPFFAGIYLSQDTTITTADIRLTEGVSIQSLAPGSPTNFIGPVSATIPTSIIAGSYYLGVLLDHSNEISETNEGNNYVTSPMTVLANAPDLVVSYIYIGEWDPSLDSVRVSVGFTNSGWSDFSRTIAFSLCISADGLTPVVPTCSTGGWLAYSELTIGGTARRIKNIFINPGERYYLIATIDNLNWVAESNEGNNRLVSQQMLSRP